MAKGQQEPDLSLLKLGIALGQDFYLLAVDFADACGQPTSQAHPKQQRQGGVNQPHKPRVELRFDKLQTRLNAMPYDQKKLDSGEGAVFHFAIFCQAKRLVTFKVTTPNGCF